MVLREHEIPCTNEERRMQYSSAEWVQFMLLFGSRTGQEGRDYQRGKILQRRTPRNEYMRMMLACVWAAVGPFVRIAVRCIPIAVD